MILFLYGEDSYRSKQKLDAIKKRYMSANLGDTNLSILDAEDKTTNLDRISREVLAMPFLAPKRLVVIRNLLTKGNKQLQAKVSVLIDKMPQTTFLVFYEEGIPDRQSLLFKKLNKPKQSQEFRLLGPHQLRSWIRKRIEIQGQKITPEAIEKLILYVGNDLWRMDNEINKLVSYQSSKQAKSGKIISGQDIELLVRPKIDSRIFSFIDALGDKNVQKAVQSLDKLLTKGENELYILAMIIYQFRNLLIVKDILENPKHEARNPKQIQDSNHKDSKQVANFAFHPFVNKAGISNFQLAKQAGLHPFVAQKTINQCQNFTLNRLKRIYQDLLDFDLSIKSGKIDPRLALDILIFKVLKEEKDD